MSHKFRTGDRIMLLASCWEGRVTGSPKRGDIGTLVGGDTGNRVLYDRPETHRRVDRVLVEGANASRGRQTWSTNFESYRYLGWRVNPEKV